MKISKLFHWLYGFIMLLPVFFVLGKVVYTSFNANAKDSYFGETINSVEYETINTLEKLESGKTYIFELQTSIQSYNSYSYYINAENINVINQTGFNDVEFDRITRFGYQTYNSQTNFFYYYETGGVHTTYISGKVLSFTFNFLSTSIGSDTAFTMVFDDSISIAIYNRYSYLDNSLAYAMSEINEVTLFSWAKDSFLVAPFTYITGLFGVAANSPITTLLSYWLAISIIWLVFDLIMYVPLLVHRWLDKGVLE